MHRDYSYGVSKAKFSAVLAPLATWSKNLSCTVLFVLKGRNVAGDGKLSGL